MPKQIGPETRYFGQPPKGEHFVVMINAGGDFTALPRGATMGIVEDPTERSPFHRMVVHTVSKQILKFKCQCNPTCQVVYEYRLLPIKGKHVR